jgi:hypothetical protein
MLFPQIYLPDFDAPKEANIQDDDDDKFIN